MSEERTVRLSQTVAPFGVGAIYDIRGESLVAVDTTAWGGMGARLELDRLATELGVEGFRSAPARWDQFSTSGPRLTYARFPRWLFCPACRRMTLWQTTMEVPGEIARCEHCEHRTPRPQLVPMRFVVTCPLGHLGDVQWHRWAHSRAEGPDQKQCSSKDLTFKTNPGAGAGLDASIVACRSCNASRSLQGISSRDAARSGGLLCDGKQPWQFRRPGAQQCEEEPIVLQRGASNLYFSDIRSAIDIPPDSDFDVFSDVAAKVTATAEFEVLTSVDSEDLMTDLLIANLANKLGLQEKEIRKVVEGAKAELAGGPKNTTMLTGDLRRDEWNALTSERSDQDERSRFLTKHQPLRPTDEKISSAEELIAEAFGPVVLVTRLREVRAMTGFRRYDTSSPKITPDLDGSISWLPAIEVFGEGLFVSLDETALQAWEARPEVVERVRILEQRRPDSLVGDRLKVASPRLVLVHTLAHLLIRQLAFESGYAAASLRERIYCAEAGGSDESYAGVLIYTAAGDAEGTLGGLVRQGRPPRMLQTMLSLLEGAAWCSSDPLCIESTGQGFQGMNRGACHACALVAETSCEYANSFLDRALLVGDDGLGFFGPALDAALKDSSRLSVDQ